MQIYNNLTLEGGLFVSLMQICREISFCPRWKRLQIVEACIFAQIVRQMTSMKLNGCISAGIFLQRLFRKDFSAEIFPG
jgi:hypothetical protein